jgi:hypothetical protein
VLAKPAVVRLSGIGTLHELRYQLIKSSQDAIAKIPPTAIIIVPPATCHFFASFFAHLFQHTFPWAAIRIVKVIKLVNILLAIMFIPLLLPPSWSETTDDLVERDGLYYKQ